jgi:hypothetical protein
MNSSFPAASGLMVLIPVIVWLIWLYIVVRFLRAFERGVRAHERLADAIVSSAPVRSARPFDDRIT